MSTKELLYTMIDELTEQQMIQLISFINSHKKKGKTAASMKGVLYDYANADFFRQEDGAWERAVKQKYDNT